MADLKLEDILTPVMSAAESAFTGLGQGVWDTVQTVVVNQMKQIAISILDIGEGLIADPPYYTAESGKQLLQMTVNAAMSTIATATELTITQVQAAMKQILDAVRAQVTTLVGNILPAF